MLRNNSKSLGNHVVSPEEEKERLQWEGFGLLFYRTGSSATAHKPREALCQSKSCQL